MRRKGIVCCGLDKGSQVCRGFKNTCEKFCTIHVVLWGDISVAELSPTKFGHKAQKDEEELAAGGFPASCFYSYFMDVHFRKPAPASWRVWVEILKRCNTDWWYVLLEGCRITP